MAVRGAVVSCWLKNQVRECNLLSSVGLAWEMMREKSSYGKTNVQQRCDNDLKSDSEMEQVSEIDIEMERGTDGCIAQEQKTEEIAAGVDELRLASPGQKTEKYERTSHSRTLGIKRSIISRSGSVSSSGSSRSGSVSSSGSSRSGSVSSSGSSRSGSVSSSGSSRSGSVSSSGSSRSGSVSSSGSSRSGSVSSSGSSRSGSVSSSCSSRSGSVSSSGSSRSVSSLERSRSSSDDSSLASRGRYVSRERSYRRSWRTYSRSRSCCQRSRCQISYRSPRRYRSRSRCYTSRSRSYHRPRYTLRYRRSRSRSRSRSSSRLRRSYYGFECKTQLPSHRRSRSRSRGGSIHLTEKDKKKLLEIAKANAAKLLGEDISLTPSLRSASSLKDESFHFEKYNSNAVKELTRKEVLNIRSLPKKRPTAFEDKFIGFYSLGYTLSTQLYTVVNL
ncbi:arginine/serine-rich protein 1 isoform X2 [Heptranchias perlo]|uniref:arginine/serine-rich protein 1 isoform X2 n=1 Tax=Heptranchias perlo TaxID=212740 RepID=UPI003559BCCD